MSEPPPAAEPKPQGKVSRFFSKLAAGPRRMLAWSLPTKAAWVTFIVLLTMTLVAWIMWLSDPASVPWRHSMTAGRVIFVLILLGVIPFVLYHGLRMWLEGESSRFPDVDFAWKSGLNALRASGIDLKATPLFLVIGSPDQRHEQSLLNAAGQSLRVRGAPEGPGALHWYANPDAIYLFCTDASWASRLAATEQKRKLETLAANIGDLEEPSAGDAGDNGAGEPTSSGSFFDLPMPSGMPTAGGMAASAGLPSPGAVRGTVMIDQLSQAALAVQAGNEGAGGPPAGYAQMPAAPQIRTGGAAAASGGSRGTLMLQGPIVLPAPAHAAAVSTIAAPQIETRSARSVRQLSPSLLPPQESAEQTQRLQYVCELLKHARAPLCGANGVLVLMPLQMISSGIRQSDELQRAVKADVSTIQNALDLRCPVTALVTGLEQESGFRELVRRVGRERAQVQRFGHRFDLRSEATVEEVASLCAHVCGAFEDWVYTLFREKEALSRPGNTKLYSLLCQVRCNLKNRLADVLTGGLGYDRGPANGGQSLLFSGCYVAATGDTEDRQAFVKGVFDKLLEEQEEVEWTQQALRTEQRCRTAAYAGFAVSAAVLITLGAVLLNKALN